LRTPFVACAGELFPSEIFVPSSEPRTMVKGGLV
jgi:hypothetical protein